MKNKRNLINFLTTGLLAVLFIAFTVIVKFVDVQPVGPEGSSVGFAGINKPFSEALGYKPSLYNLTGYLGYAVIAIAACFVIYALLQLIVRRYFGNIDKDIYALLILYVVLALFYILFEYLKVNYRPVLLDGILEASYPSSHTMLAVTITVTAMMQFKSRIKDVVLRWILYVICGALCIGVVLGRLLSGAHWLTDILGGIILSAFLIMAYYSAVTLLKTYKGRNGKEG